MKKKKKLSFIKLIFIYYKKFFWGFIILLIFTIASSSIAIIIPKLTQKLMGIAFGNDNQLKSLYSYTSLIILIFIIRGLSFFTGQIIGGRLGRKIEIDLRNRLMDSLLDIDINFYSDKQIGNILTRMISDTEILGNQSQFIPINIISTIIIFIGGTIVLFTINIKLTLISLGFLFFILFNLFFIFKILKNRVIKSRNQVMEINGEITDKIYNIRLIKTFGTEKYEKNNIRKIHKNYYNTLKKQINSQSFLNSFLMIFLSSLSILILIIGILLLKSNNLFFNNKKITYAEGMGIIISMTAGVNTLIISMMSISKIFSNIAQATSASQRVFWIINLKSKIKNNNGEIIKNISSIKFENVFFTYENKNKNIINDFSFKFEKGKSYAFVGKTGIGKTTLIKLLMRLYDPNKGKILISDKNLKELNLSSYLHLIGYVDQEPSILNASIYENIKYGLDNVSLQNIKDAANKAGIHNYIANLENGYNTKLGDRGLKLSGGQKQRLSMARVFLKNPELIILDEATSALDNKTELMLRNNLKLLMKNKMTFIIAHRLSTIKDVDEIIVLDEKCKIIQKGKFYELVEIPGFFKELHNSGILKERYWENERI